jgi:hypothetical protein
MTKFWSRRFGKGFLAVLEEAIVIAIHGVKGSDADLMTHARPMSQLSEQDKTLEVFRSSAPSASNTA